MGNLPKSPKRRRLLQFLATVGLTGLAGCSDSEETASSTTTPSNTKTRTGTETATEQTTSENQWEIDPLKHDKLVGAFYYPWYDSGYWQTWGSPSEPVLGRYDSRDKEIINQHIKWSREHGINSWIVNWNRTPIRETWIEDHFLESELSDEMSFVMHPSPSRFAWEGNYANFDDPTTRDALRRDLELFEENYFSQPNYKRIDGKPVVYYYGSRWYKGDVAGALEAAQKAIDADLYLIAEILAPRDQSKGIFRDWMDEFDAVHSYNIAYEDILDDGGWGDFIDYAESTMTQWHLMAEHNAFDFIPTVMPASYTTKPNGKPGNPIMERSPEGFQKLCQLAMDMLDPAINGIFITSFNEWPEDTSMEPGEEYEEEYLEIVEGEIAEEDPAYLEPDTFGKVGLDFNKTVTPGDHPLSMRARKISVLSEDETEKEYNIGFPPEAPYFVEGIYAPKPAHLPIPDKPKNPLETFREFGRPGQRTVFYIEEQEVSELTLWGNPIAENEISADVYFNNRLVDSLELGIIEPEPKEYNIPISSH